VSPRAPGGDRAAVERAVRELILGLGLDPAAEPELEETPVRVAGLYAEIFSGLDPANEPQLSVFPHAGTGDELIVVRDLEFHSLCVHHFVPFFGVAHVAYLPGRHIVGVSGPARLVDYYSRRPQLQERISHQIADHLERSLHPRGIAVTLEARHLCMEMRGIRKHGMVVTRVRRGALTDPKWTAQLP